MAGKELPQISFVDKKRPSPQIIIQETEKLHEQKLKVNQMISLTESTIELKVNHDGPIRLIPISDTHLFSIRTDHKKIDEMLKMLKEPNTYAFIAGDFIEGSCRGITSHIGEVEIPFGQQIAMAKNILKPYVDTGKILCLVGTYMGHEGWGETHSGIDVVEDIARGMTQPDGTPLRAVHNGGVLRMKLSSGQDFALILYHDAGGGGSDEINPLGSLRARHMEYVHHNGNSPVDGVDAGHQHHRAGVSQEVKYNSRLGKEKITMFLANGTTKGNDLDNLDAFLTAQAKGPTLPPGTGIIINQNEKKNGNGKEYWPAYGYRRVNTLFEAAKIWDLTEKQKITDELVGEIVEKARKPKAELLKYKSRRITREDDSRSPLYDHFEWKIENTSSLPIMIYLLAHARYGSSSGERDRKELLKILEQVEKDPHKYAIVLRHFVDKGVAKSFDRETQLNEMANDLAGVRENNSLLGFMMSGTLRSASWTKDVIKWTEFYDRSKRKWVKEKEVAEGFFPGDYLFRRSAIKGTPLFVNEATMDLNLGGIEYNFQFLDRLAKSGSEFDPFRGLVQAHRKSGDVRDVVAGGHMPGVGVMTTPDATYVAPGWFSDYDSGGKGNIKRVPLGGQSVILYPGPNENNKMVIPAVTFSEATERYNALMLLAGLTKKEKEKISKKKRK